MTTLLFAIALFAVLVKAGFWAIDALEADKATKAANARKVRDSAYKGPRYNAHGREVI